MTDDAPQDQARERRREKARQQRQPPSRLLWWLRAAMLLLLLGTVAGIVALWPSGDSIVQPPESRLPDTERAEVIGVNETECPVPDADGCVEATVRLLSGPDTGDTTQFIVGQSANEVLVDVGDKIRVVKSQVPEGTRIEGVEVPAYGFTDFERSEPGYWLAAAFVLIVLVFGRWHGLRALAGLGISLAVVLGFIVPSILHGQQPLLVAIFGSFAVMLATIPVAHGLGPKTIAASFGTALSLLLTIALVTFFTRIAHITGFSAGDEVAYLKAYADSLSIQGLLLAGIVIAALGVLDDVTVSQSSTVMALRRANPALGFGELFTSAIAVGRDHITATVNTLFLAYVGASLPVLLIFSIGDVDVGYAINSESVNSQIIATLTGSIGLIAAVPITTFLAALMATRLDQSELQDDHAHGHSH